MSLWLPVIVFAVLASCAVVVVVGYFRGNQRLRAAAAADPADTPVTAPGPIPPERDEKLTQTDSWFWG